MTLEDLQNRKRQLEELVEDPGWKLVTAAAQEQIRVRRMTDFAAPIGSMDDAFASCGRRAEISGLQLFSLLRQSLLDDIQADIDAKLAEERKEEE